jgi:hypothetical protein
MFSYDDARREPKMAPAGVLLQSKGLKRMPTIVQVPRLLRESGTALLPVSLKCFNI